MRPFLLQACFDLAARTTSEQHESAERFHYSMGVAIRANRDIATHRSDMDLPMYADERAEFRAEIEIFERTRDLALIEAARLLELMPALWAEVVLNTGEVK